MVGRLFRVINDEYVDVDDGTSTVDVRRLDDDDEDVIDRDDNDIG